MSEAGAATGPRWMDATALAGAIRRGDLTAEEAVVGAIARIEESNPELNAVIETRFDEAIERSRSDEHSDGALWGVPFLYKNLGSPERGFPLSMGNAALKAAKFTASRRSTLSQRLLRLGMIPIGTTNTPEFGIQPTTQPLAYGPTRNPWQRDRSSGGSSGGSAAAVAAGMVPLAHGTDSAGSLRVPAAFCGVVGLKPSRGLVPTDGVIDRNRVEHVISRTVRDSALVLGGVAGAAPGDPYGGLGLRGWSVDAQIGEVGRLRVGVQVSASGWGIAVDDECREVTLGAAERFASLGHHVEETALPVFDESLLDANLVVTSSMLKRLLQRVGDMIGRPLRPADVEPYTWALATETATPSGPELLGALEQQQAAVGRLAAAWQESGVDVLLTPATGEPPAELRDLEPDAANPLRIRDRFRRIWCFARPFNLGGQPALVLPAGMSSHGVPLGVQIAAPHGQDATVISLGAQLEELLGEAPRPPST